MTPNHARPVRPAVSKPALFIIALLVMGLLSIPHPSHSSVVADGGTPIKGNTGG